MFDASRLPPPAQDVQVAVTQPNEEARLEKRQQPQKEFALEDLPGEAGGEYRPNEPTVAVLPAPSNNEYFDSPREAEQFHERETRVRELLRRSEEIRNNKSEWRRFWFLDDPDRSESAQADGGVNEIEEDFKELSERWRQFWLLDQGIKDTHNTSIGMHLT